MLHRARRVAYGSVTLAAGFSVAAWSASSLVDPKNLIEHPFRMALIDASPTVEAPLSGLDGTPPGGTWTLPLTGPFYANGIALTGVSFTRIDGIGDTRGARSFDVVVTLQGWPPDSGKTARVELEIVEGASKRSLARFMDVPIRVGEITSFSRRISMTERDFDAFFGLGKRPTLRVTSVSRPS